MVVSESWDGRRKRVVFRTGAIGDTSAPESQTEVIETELQLMVASKISRTMKSKERRELRRRIERQMKARMEKRLRKFNGL